jgi:hypothetical protein
MKMNLEKIRGWDIGESGSCRSRSGKMGPDGGCPPANHGYRRRHAPELRKCGACRRFRRSPRLCSIGSQNVRAEHQPGGVTKPTIDPS